MYPSVVIDKGFLMGADISPIIRKPSEAYDLAAGAYDGWHWQEFWRRTETPFFDDCVEGLDVGRRGRFLDAGCGTGYYLDRYGDLFRDSDGFDASPGMLAMAAERSSEARLASGTVSSLPYASGMFDLVVCARVLSHVPDLDAVVSELVRVTAPGGAVLVSSLDASHPYAATRLPTATMGDVYADTFKHDREDVRSLLIAAGMRIAATVLIGPDGSMSHGRVGFSDAASGATAWAMMAIRPRESS
jgi:SAM-dependent methyltransferase